MKPIGRVDLTQHFYGGLVSASLVTIGVTLSLIAYHFPRLAFNYYQALGSALFWLGLFILVLTFLMRDALAEAWSFARKPKGAAVGGAYIVIHLLLYGFVLEATLVSIYGSAPFVTSTFGLVSSNLLYPPSIENAVVGSAFSPNFTLLIPPIYDASLSSFSIFTAVIIDILILANVGSVSRMGSLKSSAVRARAYLAMPVTGIALGASCCMSLPILLSIADPAFTVLAGLTWVYYVTYFVLPILAAIVLRLNLDLANRAATAATRSAPAGRPAPPSLT